MFQAVDFHLYLDILPVLLRFFGCLDCAGAIESLIDTSWRNVELAHRYAGRLKLYARGRS
jgi:hypothetical protein